MFILKKLISLFVVPLSLAIILLLIGTFLKRGRRKVLLTGIAMLYLFSFSPFSCLILRPLESRYAPVSTSALRREVRWVVVLGGGARDDKTLTPEDRLKDSSLRRVMEGVRLARMLPEARLILSGGNYWGGSPEAFIMNEVVLNQGLARERIVLESTSWDTEGEALALRDRLMHNPFYLVTSASHMPRAMRMFQRLGTQPIAAPTDFRALRGPLRITDIYPHVEALADTENAFHEYLGLLWSTLRKVTGGLTPLGRPIEGLC
jgi:uncharacterized SAM-binding protein YcdF (DUF218 family)